MFSPERVIAVVTRGGDKPGALYVHTDNLGSVDALTNAAGGVEERRSYDPFGQRRNRVWGQPPPASSASKTTLGFTGHEHDDELGLVNMRGRDGQLETKSSRIGMPAEHQSSPKKRRRLASSSTSSGPLSSTSGVRVGSSIMRAIARPRRASASGPTSIKSFVIQSSIVRSVP